MYKLTIITFLLTTIIINCCAQDKKNDSVSLQFLFPQSMVVDSNDLILSIVYRNNTDLFVEVYKTLKEGDKGDRFYNIYIEIEKLAGKKFTSFPVRYYQNPLLYRMEDSLRHYDLPKKNLAPYSTDTLDLNILNIAGSFYPGKYRFKAHLRVKTIKDDSFYDSENTGKFPPLDKIEYVDSEWLYFTVKKYISIKRNIINNTSQILK